MDYLRALAATALNALNCGNTHGALYLLDVGLSYAPGFDPLPPEAEPLWEVKINLEFHMMFLSDNNNHCLLFLPNKNSHWEKAERLLENYVKENPA